MDRIPGLPVVAHAVDFGPAAAFDHERNRVPRMPVNRRSRPGVDLVRERVQAARRAITVPAHVHAAAHAAGGRPEHHVLPADHALAVLAPLLEELGAPLLLHVVVSGGSGGLGRHRPADLGGRAGRSIRPMSRPPPLRSVMRNDVPYADGCAYNAAMRRREAARSFAMYAIAAAGLFAVGVPAHAQSPAGNREIFAYRGADREARLAERARKEGTVVVYTSLAPSESKPLAAAFEKKHGIKVQLWRALSGKIVQRSLAEASARRHAVDVIETNGPAMEMLAPEKLLAGVYSPHSADLPPNAVPAHRQWLPDRLNFFVVAYNTRKGNRRELPACT